MSDSIDRNATINALNMLFKKQVTQFGYEGYEKADEKTQLVCDGISYSIGCVLNLPSAQPQWIPCSERLPAYGEDVLISIGGYCNVGHIVSVNEEERYNWYFSGWYHSPNDVDAWMPLPEPYKEGE